MAKRILAKCGKRKKALFGSETAAILTAAGMNVAAQTAASIMTSNATKDAARKQAEATTASAQQQATALKEQNEKLNEQRKESQDFVKQQNEENRQIQKDIQMQLAMLTGQQNVNDRLEASKIKVKNGGKVDKKFNTYSLRGSNNGFKVTDGGYVVPIGNTSEGFNLFEIKGNDHEHYHKTKGGKYKSGVGIKFKDGTVVEGEGNQNTSQGEYMLQTPKSSYFISKHNILGFNPVKAVNEGMHPLMAFNIQERNKAIKGVNDDGSYKSSPLKKNRAYYGTSIPNVIDMYNQISPNLGTDIIGAASTGVAYVNNENNQLKCGGKVKRTLKCGGKTRQKAKEGGFTKFLNKNADYVGAGLTSLGNILGAAITTSGNNKAANVLSDAYNNAGKIMADAYNSLETIDLNSINRDDYKAAHALVSLQTPISHSASQLALADRQLQRRLSNAGKYSISGAGALDKQTRAEIDTQDIKNSISSTDQQQREKIVQSNFDRANQVAMRNAELDTQANQQYAQAYLDLLKYNNSIKNERRLGASDALSNAAIKSAETLANAKMANTSSWGSALTHSTNEIANTLENRINTKNQIRDRMLGAGKASKLEYYANYASDSEARNQYDVLTKQRNLLLNSTDELDKKRVKDLQDEINYIAFSRGFNPIKS